MASSEREDRSERLRELVEEAGTAGDPLSYTGFHMGVFMLLAGAFLIPAWSQQTLDLSATRPTIANSAAVQSKGVLQVEVGYDAYPQSQGQQVGDTAFYYTPWSRVRLDFDWSSFAHTGSTVAGVSGVGTITLGSKVVFASDGTHRRLPGLGVEYEAELPTASETSLQGYGQQATLLVNHLVGKLNLIMNASLVQFGCQTRNGCGYGGQQALALSYHRSPQTSIYAETFVQNVAQSNTPPGTYLFAGFLHRFSDALGIDGGLRFGVSNHSATIGTTVGLLFGKRLRQEPSATQRVP